MSTRGSHQEDKKDHIVMLSGKEEFGQAGGFLAEDSLSERYKERQPESHIAAIRIRKHFILGRLPGVGVEALPTQSAFCWRGSSRGSIAPFC